MAEPGAPRPQLSFGTTWPSLEEFSELAGHEHAPGAKPHRH